MKTFEIKALGLEEMSFEDQHMCFGGSALKKILGGGFFVAAYEWVNEHWDALVEGFERGAADGEALYF